MPKGHIYGFRLLAERSIASSTGGFDEVWSVVSEGKRNQRSLLDGKSEKHDKFSHETARAAKTEAKQGALFHFVVKYRQAEMLSELSELREGRFGADRRTGVCALLSGRRRRRWLLGKSEAR